MRNGQSWSSALFCPYGRPGHASDDGLDLTSQPRARWSSQGCHHVPDHGSTPSAVQSGRHPPAGFDKTIYKRSNEVERTINGLKNFRAVATRVRQTRLCLSRHRHHCLDPTLAPPMIRRTEPGGEALENHWTSAVVRLYRAAEPSRLVKDMPLYTLCGLPTADSSRVAHMCHADEAGSARRANHQGVHAATNPYHPWSG